MEQAVWCVSQHAMGQVGEGGVSQNAIVQSGAVKRAVGHPTGIDPHW